MQVRLTLTLWSIAYPLHISIIIQLTGNLPRAGETEPFKAPDVTTGIVVTGTRVADEAI